MRHFTKLVESKLHIHCTLSFLKNNLSQTSQGTRRPIRTERSFSKGHPRVLHRIATSYRDILRPGPGIGDITVAVLRRHRYCRTLDTAAVEIPVLLGKHV